MKKTSNFYTLTALMIIAFMTTPVMATSHFDAPLISSTPKAELTDVFTFRQRGSSNDGQVIDVKGVPVLEQLQIGIETVKILESTPTAMTAEIMGANDEPLGTFKLGGSYVEVDDGFVTKEMRTFEDLDGQPVSFSIENWMPKEGVDVDKYPTKVIFESGGDTVEIDYDLVLANGGKDVPELNKTVKTQQFEFVDERQRDVSSEKEKTFENATVERISVSVNGVLGLEMTAEELSQDNSGEIYASYLKQAGAEFALNNTGLQIAMHAPMSAQVFPFTPVGQFFLNGTANNHATGNIPKHTFWGTMAACGTHAACYFGGQIPPPCWVVCAICGWASGEAIWGALAKDGPATTSIENQPVFINSIDPVVRPTLQ